MPYLQLLFLVHAIVLSTWSWRTARRLFSSDFPALFATVLLCWANLVHTAQIASIVRILDLPIAYFLISLGVSIVYRSLFTLLCPQPEPPDGLSFRELKEEFRNSLFAVVLLAGLLVIGCLVLLLAIAVLPNNWDSLAYRFPRAFFYFNSAALLHPSSGIDPRLLFYPYNGSLLYLFLVEYQLTGVMWNLVSVAGWLMAGAGAFYLPLLLGASVRGAMFSTYALMTSPIVLCLANSTNDELLAGAPLLLSVVFLFSWFRGRGIASLVLAMIGLAISAGVKLHFIFYAPLILLCAVLAVLNREYFKGIWLESLKPNLRGVATGLLLAVPLAGGFLLTNYKSSGKLTNSQFNAQVLNSPFHVGAAAQNTLLLTSQLLLSPIPDHVRTLGVEKGAAAYKATNELANKMFFSNVKQGPPYTSPFYRFRGISSPYAEVFFEETLWLGMVPWALLIALGWMVAAHDQQTTALWLLLLSLPLWHLTICAMHLYVECIGTYYAYAAPVGLAALGLVWEKMDQPKSPAAMIGSRLLLLILASNTIMAGILLFSSQKRDVTQAFRSSDGETPVSQTSPSLRSALAKAKQVYISYTHWELLYWNLMRLNPGARYFSGNYPADAKIDLFLWPYNSQFQWDAPAPIRANRLGEFKFLGTMSMGNEVVICGGGTCLSECPTCEDIFLLPLRFERKPGLVDLFVAGPLQGLNTSQPGFLRFTLFNAVTLENVPSNWVSLTDVAKFRTTVQDRAFDHVLVEVSCESGPGCLLSRTTLPLSPGLRPLVDQMPEFSPSLDPAQVSSIFGSGWEGTEGSGYWKFQWKLRPGTNKLDATWKGGGGETASDELTVSVITEKQVLIRRKTYNSYYVGSWLPSKTPSAKGYAAWDPSNIWTGKRSESASPPSPVR